MYTIIPIEDTIEIIINKYKNKSTDKQYIEQIKSSLHFILKQNYFEFNNEIYKQNKGLAMDSPLSSIIADIYLQHIDVKIQDIIKSFDPNGTWIRYVGDGLYISNNKNIHANDIGQQVNQIHPNIHFTEEKENKINYLALTITRKDNQIQYTIYGKPTTTSLTILNDGNHPLQHKITAFHSLYNRLYKISVNTNEMLREMNIIFQIIEENGYHKNIITEIENKVIYKIKAANLRTQLQ